MSISALIIDDEQLARDELKYLLDQVGGVNVLAQGTNGIEAVDLIEEHHPDVVFLDVQMPGLDGFAVIERLMDRHRASRKRSRAAAPDRFCHGVRPIRRARLRRERRRLSPQALRPRAAWSRRWSACAGAWQAARARGPAGIANRRAVAAAEPAPGGARAPQPARLIVQAQSRLLLVDQAEICYAAIDEGVIRVVTQSL